MFYGESIKEPKDINSKKQRIINEKWKIYFKYTNF